MSEKIHSKQWLLAKQPGDNIDISSTFKLETKDISTDNLGDKIIVKVLYLSNDPAQRTWITGNIPEDRHYTKPVQPNELMRAYGVGKVVESGNSKFKKGDLIQGNFGWTEYAVTSESAGLVKVPSDVDPADFLAMQLTAKTAYFGFLRVGAATSKDQTIVISSAAGSTGSVVAQIAKNVLKCKNVIGIAGSEEKCRLLKEQCNVDIALNYKDKDFEEQLKKATPNYVDVYFDNVGGKILDLCVHRIAKHGRIVSCGSISSYDDQQGTAISSESYFRIISMRARIEGFIVLDFTDEFTKANEDLTTWVKEGKIKPLKTVWETEFENVPQGMMKLVKGDNTGKFVTKLVF